MSLPVLFGQRCVAPLLFRLSQRYPLLKLELHYSDRQVNLLEEGFDLAVRIGSLADTRVAAGPGAGRARHGAVRGGGVPAPAASAADYCRVERAPYPRLSAQRPATKMATVMTRSRAKCASVPQTWLIQDDFAAIAAAVQQGMGIAWLPDWLVAQALADGTLQQVLAPSAQVRFAIHADMAGGAVAAAKTRAAIDALREGLPLTATPG